MPKERKLQTGATDPVPIWGTTCVNSFREIPEQDCKLNCTNFVLILSSFSQQFLNWTLDRLEWSQSWVDSGKVARLVNGQGESQVAGSRLFQLSGKISAKIRNLQNSLFKEACVMQQWCKKKGCHYPLLIQSPCGRILTLWLVVERWWSLCPWERVAVTALGRLGDASHQVQPTSVRVWVHSLLVEKCECTLSREGDLKKHCNVGLGLELCGVADFHYVPSPFLSSPTSPSPTSPTSSPSSSSSSATLALGEV